MSTPVEAVIFDVDGTIAQTERDGHRVAFNKAFEALGLPYRWDEGLYGDLLWVPGGQARLHHYLTGAGMPQGERFKLVPELHRLKNRYFIEMIREGQISARPGISRLFDEIHEAGSLLGIATTGTRSWVVELLGAVLGQSRLDRIAGISTGEDVTDTKPAPDLYNVTLGRLGVDPGSSVAVEDSHLGLQSAKAAGLPCLVFWNPYTAKQDFSDADLVVGDLEGVSFKTLEGLLAPAP